MYTETGPVASTDPDATADVFTSMVSYKMRPDILRWVRLLTVTVQSVMVLSVSILSKQYALPQRACHQFLVVLSALVKACNAYFKLGLTRSQLVQRAKFALRFFPPLEFYGPLGAWDKDSGEILPSRDKLETSYDYGKRVKIKPISSRDGMKLCVETLDDLWWLGPSVWERLSGYAGLS